MSLKLEARVHGNCGVYFTTFVFKIIFVMNIVSCLRFEQSNSAGGKQGARVGVESHVVTWWHTLLYFFTSIKFGKRMEKVREPVTAGRVILMTR